MGNADETFMSAEEYGRSLKGLGINLLVRDVGRSVAFAKDGPNSRTHQLFFNLSDNAHLDRDGFVPVGRVIEGMGVVDSINAQYRENP